MENNEIAIAWADLTFRSKAFLWNSEKTVLNNLYGSVEFGTITALMGPSGAGKTTLLNCIYGKLGTHLHRETKIFSNVNNEIRSCFVAQHEKDHLIMCLTVEENLIFASKLKNSALKSDLAHIDHQLNVKNIMDELMIDDICGTRVECCSGGQQKRLTIALEMVAQVMPNLLCIDEPTTGLDSNAAEIVMQCLMKLAKKHSIAIISSIHQPNHEIVMMFDKLYVLAKGGDCIYCGPPDCIQSNLLENNISINENQVPIEHLLKLGSMLRKEQNIRILILKTREKLRISLNESKNQIKHSPGGIKRSNKSFSLRDMGYIMTRSMTQLYIRQWNSLLYQFIFLSGFALSLCKMFNENIGEPSSCFNPDSLGNDTCIEELQNDTLLFQNQNFLFFASLMSMYIHLCTSAMTHCHNARIFNHEHQNSWYSTGSYFWATNIVDILPTLILSATYGLIVYYESGQLLENERLSGYVLIIVLGYIIVESIGHNIGIILQNYPLIANMAATSASVTSILFANYYIPILELPIPMQYISDYLFPKYIYNSALLLVYGLNRCSSEEKSVILLKYNLNDQDLEYNIYILAIIAISIRILAFLSLYLMTDTRIRINIFSKRKLKNKPFELKYSIEHNSNNNEFNEMNMAIVEINIEDSLDDRQSKLHESYNNQNKLICIAWTDLTLCIPQSLFINEKVILKQINGFFEFNTINALMGPSGAGKTTLLNCINGVYVEYVSPETSIFLSKFKTIRTCFITQNQKDHILKGLTARQAITYASKLKNSAKNFDHKKNVDNIMNELLISNTSDTNVEDCSGGEQKRVVIAMELTSGLKPNLLCIDEPTSGLDSNAAEVVIKCLKKLSKNHNICVITSIHQPNNELLLMFDKLYVLSRSGHCVYSGSPKKLPEHLSDCGIEWTTVQLSIEVLLKYSCKESNDENVQKMVETTKLTETRSISSRFQDETLVFPDGITHFSKRFFLRDLWLLIKRGMTYNLRFNWKILLSQFVIYITFGLLLRLLFEPNIGRPSGCVSFDDNFNTCAKTQTNLEDEKRLTANMKFNFYVIACAVSTTMSATILSFTLDVKILINELKNGWYSTGVLYWSKTIVELFPLIMNIIFYSYIVDIYEQGNSMFIKYALFLTIGALEMQSLSHVFGILTADNTRNAVFTIIGVFLFQVIFSNLFIPIRELHYSLQVLSNLSTVKLLMESVMILFYGLGRCADREFSYILFILDIKDNDLYTNIQLLILQFIIFRVIALFILYLKVNPIVNSRKDQENKKMMSEKFRIFSKDKFGLF